MGRNLYRTLAIIFAVVLLSSGVASSASPTYYGSLNVPSTGSITANQVASGAPLCNSVAFLVSACDGGPPIASTDRIVFAGDSITYGLGINNQTTYGCSHYTWPSPCFADQVASFYGVSQANEINVGVPSTCLEATTTTGSLCNPAVATPFINSYTSLLGPYVGNTTTWFVIGFGTNDVSCGYISCNSESALDSQVSAATFKADYATIVAYLLANGVPASHIIIDEIGTLQFGVSNSLQKNLTILSSATFSFNAAIAQVAKANPGVRVALGYAANSNIDCPPSVTLTNTCLYDGVHPNNTGHANLAGAIERASTTNVATAAAESATGGVTSGLYWYLVTNPYYKQMNFQGGIVLQGPASLFGTLGSAFSLDVATNDSSVPVNFYTWGSQYNDVLFGVHAGCGLTQESTTVIFAQDCATGNAAFSGNVAAALSTSASTCTGGYRFGSTGPQIFSFAGAPTCTAPNASMYLRTDGTTGSRLYISAGGGSWNPVSGV